jgi:hypothetical protein
MATENEDWVLEFLERFAAMSESEQDTAIDSLPPGARDALLGLAHARARTAETDMVELLDSGQDGLDKLYEVADPTDLLTTINLAATERPALLVEALFAAVILHRSWNEQEPAAIVELRERWHWHVHERLDAAGQEAPDANDAVDDAPGASD